MCNSHISPYMYTLHNYTLLKECDSYFEENILFQILKAAINEISTGH